MKIDEASINHNALMAITVGIEDYWADETERDSAMRCAYVDGVLALAEIEKGAERMTNEEAIRILHPDTTVEALAEIEYFAGFRGDEAKIEAVNTACILACEALRKMEEITNDSI